MALTTENQMNQLLKGKEFIFRLSLYTCNEIKKSNLYNKWVISTTKKTLVLLPSELDEIKIPIGNDNPRRYIGFLEASQLSTVLNNMQKDEDIVPIIESKTFKNKVIERKEEIMKEIIKRIPKEKQITRSDKKDIEKATKKLKNYPMKRFTSEQDKLILSGKFTQDELITKLGKTNKQIIQRKWYLKAKKSDKVVAVPQKTKVVRGKTIFAEWEDYLILKSGDTWGSSKELAQKLNKTTAQINSRRFYLNKIGVTLPPENWEPVDEIFKIGNSVRAVHEDEGIIVGVQKEQLKELFVVQIVNAKSPFSERGDRKRYAKEILTLIPTICPM